MRKVIITGGHLTPALATIEELRKKEDIEIVFIGRAHASEETNRLLLNQSLSLVWV